MDILYVVGTGSNWQNNELRYSLRSISKYGRNVGKVYLVGYKPEFVSGDVIHIPCNDIYLAKHKNIMRKVIAAVEKSGIDSHFLISSDDHFYIEETDFDNYPIFYKRKEINGTLSEEDASNGYKISLVQTRKLLERYGLPVWQTNPHCNTHFVTDIYRRNRYLFDEAMTLEHGGELNCIMGNLLVANGAEPVKRKDIKMCHYDGTDSTNAFLSVRDCFSIGDKALELGIDRYIENLFPDKCRYEKQ